MPLHLPALPRRRFLRSTLAGTAALLAGRPLRAAARPAADPDFWALFSDTHIAADPARIAREINMADRLARVVGEITRSSPLPAGALVDGDLSLNIGEPGDYATLARLLTPLREAGIPLWLALGNHDHRENFWTGVAGAKRVVDRLPDRQAAMVPAGRANWFVLDSLDKTNSTPGVLGADQLRWLESALDANTSKPALVMVHHNPNTGGNKNGLTETEALMAILRPRRHVKAHFFGHSHRWSIDRDASGIHLVNLPATAYPFDKAQPAGWVAARLDPSGITLELRALDASFADHGKPRRLEWRG
jgi:3',5'-cyclic AMP phosphodiesterase CpdA